MGVPCVFTLYLQGVAGREDTARKMGNSMAVRIPKNVAEAAKIVQAIIWSCPSKVRGQ